MTKNQVPGTILIVGGTGKVGGAVLRALVRQGHAALSASRSGDVTMDHDSPATYANALAGVEVMFVALPDRPDAAQIERRLYRAAQDAGVRKVVKLSAASAGWERPKSFGVGHRASEEALTSSELAWTILRPTVFQETIELFCSDVAKGRMVVPRCKGAVSFVAVEDVADVAVSVLLGDDEDREILELTGPEALTFDDLADALGSVLSRTVKHYSMPRSLARLVLPRVTDMSPWVANQVVDLFAGLHDGLQSQVTTDVERVLGRPASPVATRINALAGLD